MNGKGDTYRPVDQKRYDESYDRIYGKRDPMKVIDGCDPNNPPNKIIRIPQRLRTRLQSEDRQQKQ